MLVMMVMLFGVECTIPAAQYFVGVRSSNRRGVSLREGQGGRGRGGGGHSIFLSSAESPEADVRLWT